MPLQATSGAASQDGFGGNGVPIIPNYIEEVFSTYLYAGNSSTQTITNGIDLAGEGGLVWTKARVDRFHNLEDTVRGAGNTLWANATSASYYYDDAITAFGSTGYTLGADNTGNQVNSSANYVSWTFRKQPKFFDIVTYTGNATSNRQIAHNLGSVPGCIIIRRTNAGGSNWKVNHRSLAANQDLSLNLTNAADSANDFWDNTRPTSTHFTVGSLTAVNGNGDDFVAYLFAHDAGGFGLTGTDNVISCGSYTGNSSADGPIVTLGYEPQWVMIKNTTTAGYSWSIYDNMRGIPTGPNDAYLLANTSDAEQGTTSGTNEIDFQATGFQLKSASYRYNASGDTYIYIAIRRGPMKVPTSGTSVYATDTRNGTAPNPPTFNSGFPVDWALSRDVSQTWDWVVSQRLMGNFGFEGISTVAATDLGGDWGAFGFMDGHNTLGTVNANYRSWMFRRYPNVFDVCCYTGTGSARTVSHNLGVAPEMMIVKGRAGTRGWRVYFGVNTKAAELNSTGSADTNSVFWNNTSPTSSVFTVGTDSDVNTSAVNYVAYLFATYAGVSKVGSYTGTGTTLQIDCGFTGGARFVLIKRTDSTGAWYVWDTARGIVSGNDPYLLLNSTAAEVTNTDYIDTYSAGFEISSTAPAAINASGGTFIFLAIA
jgi:hypothetical protein